MTAQPWCGGIENACCPNGHETPWQTPSFELRGRGHILYDCKDCEHPGRYSLFVFTQDTGPLAQRIRLTPDQWRKAKQLPDDAETRDYLALLSEEAA